jgi:hypothetical protein
MNKKEEEEEEEEENTNESQSKINIEWKICEEYGISFIDHVSLIRLSSTSVTSFADDLRMTAELVVYVSKLISWLQSCSIYPHNR